MKKQKWFGNIIQPKSQCSQGKCLPLSTRLPPAQRFSRAAPAKVSSTAVGGMAGEATVASQAQAAPPQPRWAALGRMVVGVGLVRPSLAIGFVVYVFF